MSKEYARQRLSLLLLYAAGVIVATMQRSVWSREHTTFSIFRQSFVHLVQHRNLYAAYPAEQGAAAADLFKYSPSAAMLFAPFALLPFPIALLLWNALNAGLLILAIRRLLPEKHANLALLLLAPETFVAIQSSSSNALVTAIILLAALAYERGRTVSAGCAVIVGTAIKIFPLASFIFAVSHRPRGRAIAAAVVSLAVLFALPLLVIPPRELAQQYRWWADLLGSDAVDLTFGLSAMRQIRVWLGIAWPNWIMQLGGGLLFLLPLAFHGDRWRRETFRLQYLCSLLLFVVLFNHQAERQSFIIAATGAVLWFVTGPRTVERAVLVGLALIGIPTVPYLALWLVMNVELLLGDSSLALEGPWARAKREGNDLGWRWTGSYRKAS